MAADIEDYQPSSGRYLGEASTVINVADTLAAILVALGSLSVNIAPGDVEIGAVEMKNATTDDRASINASGQLFVKASDLETLLSSLATKLDTLQATTVSGNNTDAAIDANTDRNTAFEIVEVSLANDDWANVTFAQAVKSFELQHQALTTDFQFRKSADTEYLTIGAGNTKHFPVSGLTTVGQVKRTGAATIVISAIGYY